MHIAIWNCSWNHGSILIILINIILLAILIKGKLWNPQLRKRSIPHSMKWVCIISNVEHIHMRCFKVGVDHCIYITTINTMKFESSVNCAKFQIFATTEIQSQNNHSIWCTRVSSTRIHIIDLCSRYYFDMEYSVCWFCFDEMKTFCSQKYFPRLQQITQTCTYLEDDICFPWCWVHLQSFRVQTAWS